MNKDEYKAKCQWLAKFYAEAAETGRAMQRFRKDQGQWESIDFGPNLRSHPDEWRLKPEPQKFWIVWEPNGCPCVFLGEEPAKNHAKTSGGTIQEIERPEKIAIHPKPALDLPDLLDVLKSSLDGHKEVREFLNFRISNGESVYVWREQTESMIKKIETAIAKAEGRGE